MRYARWLLTAAAAAVVAACGAAPTVDDPEAALVAAAERTEAAGTARMSMALTMTSPDGLAPGGFSASGEIDFAAGASHVRLETLDAPTGVPSGYDPSGDDEMEWIVHGGDVYMRMPMPAEAAQGAEWVRLPLDPDEGGLDTFGGVGAPSLGGGPGSDPADLVDHLRDVASQVTLVGDAEVRGAATTRFRATYRAADVAGEWLERLEAEAEELPPEVADEQAAWLDAWRTTPIVTEVWVDDAGLVRRIRSEVDMTAMLETLGEDPDGTVSTTVDVELFDFGAAVTIEPPDEELVTDLGTMMAEERAAADITELPVPDETVPSPGEPPPAPVEAVPALPEGFPDNFPVYLGYRSLSTQTADDDERYDVRLAYDAADHPDHDDLFAELVGFYEDALPSLGWTTTDTRQRDDAVTFAVTGHGYRGQVTVSRAHAAEVEVHIELER